MTSSAHDSPAGAQFSACTAPPGDDDLASSPLLSLPVTRRPKSEDTAAKDSMKASASSGRFGAEWGIHCLR